jgi:hypothetical protein
LRIGACVQAWRRAPAQIAPPLPSAPARAKLLAVSEERGSELALRNAQGAYPRLTWRRHVTAAARSRVGVVHTVATALPLRSCNAVNNADGRRWCQPRAQATAHAALERYEHQPARAICRPALKEGPVAAVRPEDAQQSRRCVCAAMCSAPDTPGRHRRAQLGRSRRTAARHNLRSTRSRRRCGARRGAMSFSAAALCSVALRMSCRVAPRVARRAAAPHHACAMCGLRFLQH